MRVFDVIDADGKLLALFYGDFFKRDNKNGGAWMSSLVRPSQLLGTQPVIYNVCNYSKPAPGEPALISFSDVTTLFHEFGHALHGMFSEAIYPSLAGTSVARDFVEFPSQFNEHWATYPGIFEHYARHYETGAPYPGRVAQQNHRRGKVQRRLCHGRDPGSGATRHAMAHAPMPAQPSKIQMRLKKKRCAKPI